MLYSAAGTFDAASTGVSGWYGASNLNWAVAAGTYWAAFEVGAGDTFSGVAPVIAPLPLANYAYNDGSGYAAATNYSFGVQISAVPVPAAVWLFGSAVLGFAGLNRRKQALV